MNVLLTGAAGQLGRALQDCKPDSVELTSIDIDELDITSESDTLDRVRGVSPDRIINTAAYTAVDLAESNRDAAYAVNAQGARNLALAAKAVGAGFLHLSTDYVFDGRQTTPYLPDAHPSPLGVYGQSKLQGEQLILQAYPERSSIIRTAWLYSPYGKNFLLTMVRMMAERDEIRVVADQVGTPTSAATLAEALWRMCALEHCRGIHHWTDLGVASWYDFAVAIQEEARAQALLPRAIRVIPIRTEDFPTQARRPACALLDKSSCMALTGLPGVHWREALRHVIAQMAMAREGK